MVLSMNRWKGKIAVVTGAGGGLGSAVVKQLLEEGLKVVAVDSNPKSLQDLSKTITNNKENVSTFTTDVSKDTEVVKLFQQIKEELGQVHILINCAGIFHDGNLTDNDTEIWKNIFGVNVIGLSIMTREAVNSMKENGIDGHIIHIGSVAGHLIPPVPGLNVYPASKYAVRALTETLRQELVHLGLKIKITCVSPGKMETPLVTERADDFVKIIGDWPSMEPGDVAEAIVYILSTPPHVQVHEMVIKPVGEIV